MLWDSSGPVAFHSLNSIFPLPYRTPIQTLIRMNNQISVLNPPSALPTIDQLIDLEIRVIDEIAALKEEIDAAMPEIDAISPGKSIGHLSRNAMLQSYEMIVEAQHRREARLVLLERALHRMDIGDYGECETCREGISWARLDAQPEARYCTSCVL